MLAELSIFLSAILIFLFAIVKLSAEVQRLFTARVRQYIRAAVRTPLYGLVAGIASTILFQSSSTTTSLIVGMVSAGLLSLYHGLAVVLGTDIGTTLTVQLVVWKVTALFPVCVVGGGILWLIAAGKRKAVGEVVFYFGLVLFSLYLIGQATAPLNSSKWVGQFFREAGHPGLGFVIGLLFTAIVHSSAISISMLAMLGQQDVVTLDTALPIIIGANVGTTVTALLAGVVSNVSGKRTAVAHLFFKCVGALVGFLLLPFFGPFLRSMTGSLPQQIALAHFFLNLSIVLIFIFLLKPVSGLLERSVPGREEVIAVWPEFLNEACLVRTDEALLCVKRELVRQMLLAQRMVRESIELTKIFRKGVRQSLVYIEAVVDNLRSEIAHYLWHISEKEFTEVLSKRLFAYTAMVDDVERIGDHAVILAKLASEKHERKIEFSERGMAELDEIDALVLANVADALRILEERDEFTIEKIAWREDAVDAKVREARERHLERFHRRICRAESGPIFLEILINLERISDHCMNVAEYVKELK
jgi:phosphate:Na+ symporter